MNEQYRRLSESKNRQAGDTMDAIRELALQLAATLDNHGDVGNLLRNAKKIEEYLKST